MKVIYWIARLTAAVIMLQTLFFKFSGAPESVEIFSRLQAEPFGRYATGALELVAAVMLLLNATSWIGAMLTLGLMAGAIASHVFILGIEIQGDHGQLFAYAVIAFVAAACVLFCDRARVLAVYRRVSGK
jgi:uncharacterized membrane protein YphA (DoxX/SURF4 family)